MNKVITLLILVFLAVGSLCAAEESTYRYLKVYDPYLKTHYESPFVLKIRVAIYDKFLSEYEQKNDDHGIENFLYDWFDHAIHATYDKLVEMSDAETEKFVANYSTFHQNNAIDHYKLIARFDFGCYRIVAFKIDDSKILSICLRFEDGQYTVLLKDRDEIKHTFFQRCILHSPEFPKFEGNEVDYDNEIEIPCFSRFLEKDKFYLYLILKKPSRNSLKM
jgi:hypothetical protein